MSLKTDAMSIPIAPHVAPVSAPDEGMQLVPPLPQVLAESRGMVLGRLRSDGLEPYGSEGSAMRRSQ